MRPLRAHVVALVRGDVPIREIDLWRSLGGEAYHLFDESRHASWERLAAWTALMLQLYADNLVTATEPSGYVPADTAVIVRQLYGLVRVWLERAKQLRATPNSVLQFHLPNPLPRWPPLTLRSNAELAGMRRTLEAAQARVGVELEDYDGPETGRDHLSHRMIAVDSALETVELLWVGRGSDELRDAIAKALTTGLEQANELGQLLAQPALLARL